MNKSQLVATVAEQADVTKATSNRVIDAFLDAVVSALATGESVNLVNFGTFGVNERAARVGRNPRTGAEVQIAAKKVVKFKPGKPLQEAANTGRYQRRAA